MKVLILGAGGIGGYLGLGIDWVQLTATQLFWFVKTA